MPSNSRSRRFSVKEVLILLLPCLLLAGFAFAMRHRGGNTITLTNRFSLIMEKYEFEPVTPREVSQGFQRKVESHAQSCRANSGVVGEGNVQQRLR